MQQAVSEHAHALNITTVSAALDKLLSAGFLALLRKIEEDLSRATAANSCFYLSFFFFFSFLVALRQRRAVRSAAVHQPDGEADVWGAEGEGHQPDDPPPEQIHGLQVRPSAGGGAARGGRGCRHAET